MEKLNVILTSHNREISLSPFDSDSFTNLILMEQLVGTLVKSNEAGKYEGFIAKSWHVSDDAKIWDFVFNEGVNCEDGQLIFPNDFKISIERNIRILAKNKGKVPIFDYLKGYEEFINDKKDTISGIEVSRNSIKFIFTQSVRSGLIEFLSMPYFGYYCKADFDQSNNWVDKKHITSSGVYRLDKISNNKVQLSKRDTKKEGPRLVEIIQEKINFDVKPTIPTLVIGLVPENNKYKENYNLSETIPDLNISVVLSPNSDLFKNKAIRDIVQKRINSIVKNYNFPNIYFTNYFYSYQKTVLNEKKIDAANFKKTTNEIKVILTDHLSDQEQNIIINLLNEALPEYQDKIKYVKLDRNVPNWFDTYTDNKSFDIRIAGVSAGGSFQNWLINLMFCTKLGISFPDPTGRICSLVHDFDLGKIKIDDYAAQFNQILYEDASVIPLYQKGFAWLTSDQIKLTSANIGGIPRFETIRLKE